MFTDGKGNRLSQDEAGSLLSEIMSNKYEADMSEASGLSVIERPTCQTCVYLEDDVLCKRHSPTVVSRTDFEGYYPETTPEGWCGSHNDFPAYLASLTPPKALPEAFSGYDDYVEATPDPATPINRAWLARFSTAMDKVARSYAGGKYNTLFVSDLIDLWDESDEVIVVDSVATPMTHGQAVEWAEANVAKVSGSTLFHQPSEHELKCWPEFFQAVKRGEKTAELRWDDRGFQVGDTIVLHEWSPETKLFTDEDEIRRTITHVTRGSRFGLMNGFAMLSLGSLPTASVAEMAAVHDAELNGATDRLVKFMSGSVITNKDAEIATLKATAVEQAEIIAMKDETIKLKNEAIATLREDEDLLNEMAEASRRTINNQAKGMEGLRGVIESKDAKIKSLRGEVTQLGELNDRQERKLDEANKLNAGLEAVNLELRNNRLANIRDRNEVAGQLSQANERYQELAEAAQRVNRSRTMSYVFFDARDKMISVEREELTKLDRIIARHASSADKAVVMPMPNKSNVKWTESFPEFSKLMDVLHGIMDGFDYARKNNLRGDLSMDSPNAVALVSAYYAVKNAPAERKPVAFVEVTI